MATATCDGAVNCEGVDNPVANLSSEGPDVFKCFTHIFSPSYAAACEFPLTFCNQMSALGINVGVFCDLGAALPPTNPPPPTIYSSDARSCTVDCGDGTTETYEVAAGTFVGLSQSEANARAFNFACQLAAMLCNGPLPELFTNTPQTCSDGCPDGSSGIYTTPAGFFTALSQAEADSEAFSFACEMAELLRSCNPPLDIVPGAGVPLGPNAKPTYGNSAQSCTVACPNGSLYTHVVSSGTYTDTSRAAANARAHALACQLANAQRVCLSDLPPAICEGDFFGEFLEATGLTNPTFSIVAGSLPSGIVLGTDGFMQGVANLLGNYAFTIRATSNDGRSVQRSYNMAVVGIDQVALPDGDSGAAYAEQLTASGFTNPTWTITFGVLPSGLALNPNTGLISGTPDTGGDYPFTVEVSEGSISCTCDLSITINSTQPAEWWKLDAPGPGNRVGSIAGVVLEEALDPVGSAAGKINLGANLVSGGGGNILFVSAGVPAIAYTGNGFDAFGWINPLAFSSAPFDEFTGCGWQDTDLSQYKFQVLCEPWFGGHPGVVGPPMMKFNVHGDGLSENIYYPIVFVPGTWIFWRVFYDPSTSRFGVQVNNGAIMLSSPQAFSPFTNGGWVIFDVSTPGSSFVFDETGLFLVRLSDAQASAIYNSGLGKTFP
jgi:hypothetical protein